MIGFNWAPSCSAPLVPRYSCKRYCLRRTLVKYNGIDTGNAKSQELNSSDVQMKCVHNPTVSICNSNNHSLVCYNTF